MKSSVLEIVPLGVVLLGLSSLALVSPGADKRPAPSFSIVLNGRSIELQREIGVQDALESIHIEPARTVFLESVILQGSVGDKKVAIRELRKLGNSEALGDIGDTRSVNIISVALRDPDPELRQRAAETLDQLRDDALFHAPHPAQ